MNFGELKKTLGYNTQPDPPTWIMVLAVWLLIPASFVLGLLFCLIDAYLVQQIWAAFFPDMYQFTFVQAFAAVLIMSIFVEPQKQSFEDKSEVIGYFMARLFLRPLLYLAGVWVVMKVFV